MRKPLSAAALFLAAAATLVAPAIPAFGTTVSGVVADRADSAAVSETLPSCRAITYRGDGGAIHIQTSPNGTVVWGIYMYDSGLGAGPWTVDVYVGNRLDDHKEQDYAPHGSVNPKHARKGAVFRITATHYATANQTWYDSVTNGCIIP